MGVFDSIRRIFGGTAAPERSTIPLSSADGASGQAAPAMRKPHSGEPPTASSSELTPIGRTDAVCPYCDAPLAKMPGRKKKCPACSQYIYIRTRPLDRQRVLLTESELPAIEAQWAGNHLHSTLSRSDDSGLTPDQLWGRCNKELLENAKSGNWGLYRNTRLDMASLLHREGRPREALVTYLEVSYIDLNGPQNMGGMFDSASVRQFPPFSREDAMLAPGVIAWTSQLAEELNLERSALKQMFLDMGTRLQHKLRMPVSPEEAWRLLQNELDSGGA